MALITLLRHAALPLEYQKRYIGHSDIEIDLSLTDISKLDEIKNRKYDLIFSSDLKRCTQTLDLFNCDYIIDKRLREIEFKEKFEKLNFSEVEKTKEFKKEYLDSTSVWHEFICKESLEDFEKRVEGFIKELAKDKNILICSHGGAIRMLYSKLLNKNYEKLFLDINYLEYVDI